MINRALYLKTTRFIIPLIMAVALSIPALTLAEDCLVNANSEAQSRAFMKKAGLISKNDEIEYKGLGLVTKWTLVRSLKRNDACVNVMELCFGPKEGPAECEHSVSDSYEVLASKGGTVMTFEMAFPEPQSVVASIGRLPGDDAPHDLFFATFKGKSAIAALKSIYSQVPICGFSGEIIKGTKASFDPTPSRNWSIDPAEFNIRRGVSAEIYDIRAIYLDQDLDSFYRACTGKVMPWGNCFLRQVLSDDSKWVEVKYTKF